MVCAMLVVVVWLRIMVLANCFSAFSEWLMVVTKAVMVVTEVIMVVTKAIMVVTK